MIAVTGTAANVAGIVGGIIVFGDPLSGHPLTLLAECLAFALVLFAAWLTPAPVRGPHRRRGRSGVVPVELAYGDRPVGIGGHARAAAGRTRARPPRSSMFAGSWPPARCVTTTPPATSPARCSSTWTRSLAAPPGAGGRHPLPAAADFEADMRAAGVDADRAGRRLRRAGPRWPRPAPGGCCATSAIRRWRCSTAGLPPGNGAGLPLQTGGPQSRAGDVGDFAARAGGMPVLDAAGAAALARRGGVLLDARAPERFRGESEPMDPVAGHIPGARNRPTALNVGPSGRFLDPAALREAFAAVGVDGGAEVGAYCGSGITAAHQVLALELAGYTAALYPGSWSEWILRPAAAGGHRPVAPDGDSP